MERKTGLLAQRLTNECLWIGQEDHPKSAWSSEQTGKFSHSWTWPWHNKSVKLCQIGSTVKIENPWCVWKSFQMKGKKCYFQKCRKIFIKKSNRRNNWCIVAADLLGVRQVHLFLWLSIRKLICLVHACLLIQKLQWGAERICSLLISVETASS